MAAIAYFSGPLRGAVQQPGEFPVTTVFLPDWGFQRPDGIRQGQVSAIAEPDGTRLVPYALHARVLQPPSGELRGFTPEFRGNSLLVADFASGASNRLGGYFNTFQRDPSWAEAAVVTAKDGRRALRLRFARKADGFAGLWVHLFDFTASPQQRRYLDARPFSNLSFWIRGVRSGERLLLKIADAEMERKEDAYVVGNVEDFLSGASVDTVWQQAVVPLNRLPKQLDRSRLASFVLEAATPASSAVFISSLAFSLEPQPLPVLPDPEPAAAPRRLSKATWVWNTAELLADARKLEALLGLVAKEGIDHIFLQLPGPADGRVPSGEIVPDPRLRPLLAHWNRAGVRVYALDGYAGFALPDFHASVLRTIDNVILFNAKARPEERFYGIRYDIEPYLLPGFHGLRREAILRSYLELTADCARKTQAAGLAYGVDIPFWYDAPDEYTYRPVTVEFNGERKPVSHHVIDLVDDLTVMDYRTTAHGADGTIRHGAGELAYAAARGKAIFIGLETAPLADELLFDFSGEPERGVPERSPSNGLVLMAAQGDSALVLVITPGEAGQYDSEAVAERLRRAGADPGSAAWWPVRRSIEVPSDRLSFWRLGTEPLRRVIEQTTLEFQRYDSFAGFALHHADSYLELRAHRR